MNAVFFIGIGVTLFLSGLVVMKKNKASFDYILLGWLLVNGLHLLYFYTNIVVGIVGISKYWLIPGALLAYLSAPMLFLYVRELISPKKRSAWNYLVHFFPFVAMWLAILYQDLLVTDIHVYVEESVIWYKGTPPILIRNYSLVMAFVCVVYPCYCIYLLQKHRQRIKEEFSYLEKVTLDWLRHWLILEFVGFWITFCIIWVASFQYMELITSFKVVSVVLAVNVFIIGFYGVRQEGIFIKYIPPTLPQETEQALGRQVETEKLKLLAQQLQGLMESEKRYLDSKLNASDLAAELGISRHELSQVLNEYLKGNFYDYVNGYRVAAVKERINNPDYQHLSILGIALESGFNSKSAFNMVFKKVEGVTPSDYKRNLQQGD